MANAERDDYEDYWQTERANEESEVDKEIRHRLLDAEPATMEWYSGGKTLVGGFERGLGDGVGCFIYLRNGGTLGNFYTYTVDRGGWLYHIVFGVNQIIGLVRLNKDAKGGRI